LTQSIQIIKKIYISLDSPAEVLNMNNSTRNLKMKKLLIATTALVATAGMASADITITGHAAAGIYSGLSNKDGNLLQLLQPQQLQSYSFGTKQHTAAVALQTSSYSCSYSYTLLELNRHCCKSAVASKLCKQH